MTTYLNTDAAGTAIGRFNSNRPLLAAERLIGRHFASPQEVLDLATIAERVVLIDGVGGTRMSANPAAMSRTIVRLEANSRMMLEVLAGLEPDALESRPERVVDAAKRILPVFLDGAEGAGASRAYSFASKFLHWTTREHFPIVSSPARLAIRQVQIAHGLGPLLYVEFGDAAEYPRWIAFYSALIRSLPSEAREQLCAADEGSQPAAGRRSNSLLRVLAKAFHMHGSAPRTPARTKAPVKVAR